MSEHNGPDANFCNECRKNRAFRDKLFLKKLAENKKATDDKLDSQVMSIQGSLDDGNKRMTRTENDLKAEIKQRGDDIKEVRREFITEQKEARKEDNDNEKSHFRTRMTVLLFVASFAIPTLVAGIKMHSMIGHMEEDVKAIQKWKGDTTVSQALYNDKIDRVGEDVDELNEFKLKCQIAHKQGD
jgi:hypothetical protein